MGVDWYTCERCGETFPDCGYYVGCEECWTQWCCDKCAAKDGALWNVDGYVTSCNFCRKEDLADCRLVPFLLTLVGMDRAEAVKKFYEENK